MKSTAPVEHPYHIRTSHQISSAAIISAIAFGQSATDIARNFNRYLAIAQSQGVLKSDTLVIPIKADYVREMIWILTGMTIPDLQKKLGVKQV